MRKRILAASLAMFMVGCMGTTAMADTVVSYVVPGNSSSGGVTHNGVYYPNGYWKDGVFYPQSSWANMPGAWDNGNYYPYGYGPSSYDPYINSYVYYPYGSYYSYSPNVYIPNNSYYYNNNYSSTYYTPSTTTTITYPYGYYPYGYYTGQVIADSTLGGVSVPNVSVTQASANNKNLGFVLRGQSLENSSNGKAPATGRTASILDFSESVGRDINQNVSVTLRAIGSNVSADDQAAVSLMGKVQNLIDAKDLGIGSIAYADRDCNTIASINVRDAIASLKKAMTAVGADARNDSFMFETVPVVNVTSLDQSIQDAYARVTPHSSIYQVNVYIIKDNKRIDVSDRFGDVYMRVKADDAERALLSYYSADDGKFTVAQKSSFVVDQGTKAPSAYGYIPAGEPSVVVNVKAK